MSSPQVEGRRTVRWWSLAWKLAAISFFLVLGVECAQRSNRNPQAMIDAVPLGISVWELDSRMDKLGYEHSFGHRWLLPTSLSKHAKIDPSWNDYEVPARLGVTKTFPLKGESRWQLSDEDVGQFSGELSYDLGPTHFLVGDLLVFDFVFIRGSLVAKSYGYMP